MAKRLRESEVFFIDDDEPIQKESRMEPMSIVPSGGGTTGPSKGIGQSIYETLNPKQKAALTRFVKSRGRRRGYSRYRRGYGGRRYYRGGYRGGSSGPISIVQGRGDYTLGGQVGAKIGGYIGDRVHNFVSGFGDYHSSADLYGRLPTMVNQPSGGGTIIRFQEYISDVVTSATPGAFDIKSYTLNPGQSNSFPWLAQIAQNFEQYQFEGIIFQFRSTSANALNSTNTALGTVMMATQYDTIDQPFSSKAEMLNYEFSVSVKPSESCLHMVECASNQTTIDKLYVLDGSVPPYADPRLYNLGRFSIATTGFQGASVNVGELHATYQVRLLKPKLYASLGNEIDTYYMRFDSNVGAVYDTLSPLGLSSSVWGAPQVNNMGLVQEANRLVFTPSSIVKQYNIMIRWRGSVNTGVLVPTISVSGGLMLGGVTSAPQNTISCFSFMIFFTFRSSGTPTIPTISVGTDGLYPTGSNPSSLIVSVTQSSIW